MKSFDCHKCKGKLDCGLKFCPILDRFSNFKVRDIKDFSGVSPPSVFIGSRLNYPAVNIGVMSPIERVNNIDMYNNQRYWANNNFNINQISGLRSSLVNSRIRAKVTDARNVGYVLEMLQEIGMSFKPTNINVELKKKLSFNLKFDQINSPIGASGNLKKLELGNVKIHTKVEKVFSDIDLKSKNALLYLSKSFDEQALSQILSVGVTGIGKNRKFVPTRNSITAVDDLIGKDLIREIKDYDSISEYRFYYGNYLGNYYFVFLFPEVFNYELFEVYMNGSVWNLMSGDKVCHDYEDYYGRKDYASNTVGGYYASRLGVLEELKRLKRQAGVLVVRFETPEYYASLGVWVVREACRKAMLKCEKFNSMDEMFRFAKKFNTKKLNIFGATNQRFVGFPLDDYLNDSWLIKKIRTQKRLFEF